MKRRGPKVPDAAGDAEAQDIYARLIGNARYFRETGKSPDRMLPVRFSKDVNEGPAAEQIGPPGAPLYFSSLPLQVWGIFGGLAAAGGKAPSYMDTVPAMLELSEREIVKAAAAVDRALQTYKPASYWELVWCLAVQQTKDKRKERKRTRTGMQGILFVEDVELMRREMGPRGKLGAAIRLVWEQNPHWYGHFSEKSLREVFHAARRERAAVKAEIVRQIQVNHRTRM
jgi:hypothetical protein